MKNDNNRKLHLISLFLAGIAFGFAIEKEFPTQIGYTTMLAACVSISLVSNFIFGDAHKDPDGDN